MFLKALQGKTDNQGDSKSGGKPEPTTVELLRRFDCLDAARQLHYANCEELQADQLFDALAMASSLDDLTCACRILAQGWRWYKYRPATGQSLCPLSETRLWTSKDARQIQPAWVWALTYASSAAKEDMRWDDEDKWQALHGCFMSLLTRCE